MTSCYMWGGGSSEWELIAHLVHVGTHTHTHTLPADCSSLWFSLRFDRM